MKTSKISEKGQLRSLTWLVLIVALLVLLISFTIALPTAPTVTYITNSTMASGAGRLVNGTGNDTAFPHKAGGTIYTVNLNGNTQNNRWKAYVGNVTGKLVLDDSDGYTIYDWTVTSAIRGRVYATRTSASISWGVINCSNSGNISLEEAAMDHVNNPSDNISATFDLRDNKGFFIGSVPIYENTCYTTNLFFDSVAPGNDAWEEVVLYDGANIVYGVAVDDNNNSYHTGLKADFQILLPEKGTTGWQSSTAYYFYVELT
jgi:hypothetical protein